MNCILNVISRLRVSLTNRVVSLEQQFNERLANSTENWALENLVGASPTDVDGAIKQARKERKAKKKQMPAHGPLPTTENEHTGAEEHADPVNKMVRRVETKIIETYVLVFMLIRER